jgi:hypothetical protein
MLSLRYGLSRHNLTTESAHKIADKRLNMYLKLPTVMYVPVGTGITLPARYMGVRFPIY